MNKIFCFLLLFSTYSAFAQDIQFASLPQLHNLTDSQKKFSAVYILKERLVEYKSNPSIKEIEEFVTDHFIVKVNSDKGIEEFNTFNFVEAGDGFITLKARSIQPSGKVIDIAPEKIKSQTNKNGNATKLIAIEGLEKGSEIEIIAKQKLNIDFFGYCHFQFVGVPVLNAKFTLIHPKNLQFETKGYNGFPSATSTTNNDITTHTSTFENIESMQNAEYSNKEGYMKRIDYKLSYVEANPGQRMYTWDVLARNLYSRYYVFNDKELKVVNTFLNENNITNSLTEEEKITKIEDLVKSKIVISNEVSGDKFNEIDFIINKKVATEVGLATLLAACFNAREVQYEFGISAPKEEVVVDKEFENWKFLDEYYIYFPNQKKYISPSYIELRYPFFNSNCVGNYGIFCKVLSVAGAQNAKSQLRKINSLPFDYNKNDMEVLVNFTGATLISEIESTHSLYGHYAEGLRGAFLQIPEDKKKELIKQLVQYANTLDDIKTYSIENKEMYNFNSNKPLIYKTKVVAKELNGKAGNKYLFKVGALIGAQNEMYKENELRTVPIEIQYAQIYTRKIVINIPDGYEIKNPESVIINKDFTSYGFVSNYEKKDNKLIINISEYYKEIFHPASEIDNYRQVINAAADFNKIVLVLEKKG